MTRALIAGDETHLAQHLKEQLRQLWPELDIVHVARHGIEAELPESRAFVPLFKAM